MRNKLVTVEEAVNIVHDGDTVCVSGFGTNGVPEALAQALAKRYQETAAPRGITLLFGGGPGDGGLRGMNLLAQEGLIARVIGGHYGLIPKIGELALSGKIEAYNLPLGVISHIYRDIAAGLPATISKVGIGTFVDPRLEGGKVNAVTKEDLVEVVSVRGKELLSYKTIPINVAFIRGTTADPEGNVMMERETLTQDALAIAMAAKNSGGFVAVQVERVAERHSLNPRVVKIPGILVDCIVLAKPQQHMQTFGTQYNAAYSSEIRAPLDSLEPMPLDERKVIARRAAFELLPNAVVNLGIGMPEGVASIANEEKILRYMTLTAEPGVIGGVPARGLDFGAAVNPDAIIDMNQQFDFYDGGGLDLAVLGLAECDAAGNINVSRFGPKLAGAGGFINITQNSAKVVFVGTFTAGGLKLAIEDGKLVILTEGRAKKFVKKVEQVTFSGGHAAREGKEVYYVTERCVFKLAADGVELIEIAPGVELEKHILPHMDFEPIMRDVQPMDARLFLPGAMGLKDSLLSIALVDRIIYDAAKQTLFLNFEGLKLRAKKDVDAIRAAVEERCQAIGRKVAVIVNYDSFEIDEAVVDAYGAMVRELSDKYYTHVTRYTTSAFLRMKLGDALSGRGLSPHIFETQREALENARGMQAEA
ncbi:MAG: acyl CoA:acetate/3-ketoacid CoA transferase [Rhodomicrobium sp.]